MGADISESDSLAILPTLKDNQWQGFQNIAIDGEGIIKLKDSLILKEVSIKRVGEDIIVEGYVRENNFIFD